MDTNSTTPAPVDTANYVLVISGKPLLYKNASDAVNGYVTAIKRCPNAYNYKIQPDRIHKAEVIDELVKTLDDVGKLTFYSFTNHTNPDAIALYKSERPFDEVDWYNKAAKENLKNYHLIDTIEYTMAMRCVIGEGSKALMLGDFIQLANGNKGRIEAITDDYVAINFKTKPDHCISICANGEKLSMASPTLERYEKPTEHELTHQGTQMGTYWTKGDASFGCGNNRLNIYAMANVWHLDDVRTYPFEPFF